MRTSVKSFTVFITCLSHFVHTCMYTYMHLHMSYICVFVYGCVNIFVIFLLQTKPRCTKYGSIYPFLVFPKTLGIDVFSTHFVCGSTYRTCFLLILVFCVLGFMFAHILEYVIDIIVIPSYVIQS